MPPFGKIEPKFGDDDSDNETPIAINHTDQPAKRPGEDIDINAFTAATAPQTQPESTIISDDNDLDVASFDTAEESRPKTRINKKRAFGLLFFIAILVSALVFAGDLYDLTSETVKEKINEVEDIAKLNQPPTNYIDDGEQQNSYLKENSEAKQANVSVFDFDINNCLQQYSDAQCTDMYEKHLLISEKK